MMNRLPRLRVSEWNPHGLADDTGKPFFLLGDTAWELCHRLTRAETDFYFANRAAKGFNLVCAVALAEFDGLRTPNAEGHLPLHDLDPHRPNDAYFALVDWQIASAAAHGLYVGLLPTWGDKLTAPWGDGPRIFGVQEPRAAFDYGRWLGARYKDATNLLWILGGDRPPSLPGDPTNGDPSGTDWTPLWRAMAAGISEGTGGRALMSYHPQGGPESTSQFLHGEPWLALNMMQSGHGDGHDVPVWDRITRDYALAPVKPTLDAEPNYEDHPVNPWPVFDPANGYFRDDDVRRQCWRSVLAGGCGVIYGHHAVWQFWDGVRPNINHADRLWREALDRPGAFQVGFLRRLMESRFSSGHFPDQSLLASDPATGKSHIRAARDQDHRSAVVYVPAVDQSLEVNLSHLAGPRVRAAWLDPRTGQTAAPFGDYPASGPQVFTPPGPGDWALLLDGVP